MAESSTLDDDRIRPRIPQPPPSKSAFKICTVSLWLNFSDGSPVLSIRPHEIPLIPPPDPAKFNEIPLIPPPDPVKFNEIPLIPPPDPAEFNEVMAAGVLLKMREVAAARAPVNPLGLSIPKRRRSLRRWG